VIASVLYQDLVVGGRRRRWHLLRWICGGLLLAQFAYLYLTGGVAYWAPGQQPGAGLMLASHAHLRLLAWEQFLLVVLITPAFVAGEVTDAKTCGTLAHLLTTRLRSWEILLGKLLAQGVTLAALLSLTFPLLCFSAAGLGMPFVPLVAQVLGMVVLALLLGSAGLLASVWCRSTSDAILSVYGVILVLLLAGWGLEASLANLTGVAGAVSGWLARLLAVFDPEYLMEPAWADAPAAVAWQRLLTVTVVWGTGAALCLVLACWRLRPAYARQLEASGRRKGSGEARRPPLGDEPVLWREEHVEGVAPLAPLRRVPRWLGVALVALATLVTLGLLYAKEAAGPSQTALDRFGFQFQVGMVMTFLAAVLVGARSSAAITREREGRTWEALLLTPLVTQKVIDQKFRGILRAALPYLFAYGVPALILALLHDFATPVGRDEALLSALTDFLLVANWLLAAFVLMYWVAACGLACSAGASSSWRSLLGTFGLGYLVGVLFCLLPSAILGGFMVVLLDRSPGTELGFGGLVCAGVPLAVSAGFFWVVRVAARSNLDAAEGAILKAERTWTIPEGMLRDRRWPYEPDELFWHPRGGRG
jgi:ABC-type transport system involved in multi-copper enzyme maturation permease subunit